MKKDNHHSHLHIYGGSNTQANGFLLKNTHFYNLENVFLFLFQEMFVCFQISMEGHSFIFSIRKTAILDSDIFYCLHLIQIDFFNFCFVFLFSFLDVNNALVCLSGKFYSF